MSTAFKPARVQRPLAATLEHDDRKYVAVSSLSLQVPEGGAILPLRLFSKSEVDVDVLVDGGSPRRRTSGAPRHVTTSRHVRVDGDARLSLRLGDDLEPGTHTVSLRYDRRVQIWLSAPWRGQPRKPLESEWIAGDMDP
jgi:hypothetical protein